jgi:hypothetical protein
MVSQGGNQTRSLAFVTASLPDGRTIKGVTFPNDIVQAQRQVEEANDQTQEQSSNSAVAQPEVQPEPKPVPVENPNPPAQAPNIVEIDQLAAALWNQRRYSEAMPLFNQACSGGKTNSCYYLGLMYDFGQGVAQDASRATGFYSKSCNAGNGAACFHLGMLRDYQPGSVICASPAVNVTASRACDASNAMSCTMLGYSYSYGCGVAKDTKKGRQLLSKGCSLGYERACDGIK